MSARKLRVRLTAEARQDYGSILLYTRRTWGINQQAAYRSAQTNAFRLLSEYPISVKHETTSSPIVAADSWNSTTSTIAEKRL